MFDKGYLDYPILAVLARHGFRADEPKPYVI